MSLSHTCFLSMQKLRTGLASDTHISRNAMRGLNSIQKANKGDRNPDFSNNMIS